MSTGLFDVFQIWFEIQRKYCFSFVFIAYINNELLSTRLQNNIIKQLKAHK